MLHDRIWRLRSLAVKPQTTSLLDRFRRWGARKAYKFEQERLGFYIPITVCFAGKPILPHGLHGIFIAKTARIGRDCVIFHQVTIGGNQLIDSKGLGSPVIGDCCYIGAGAKIIGGIRIGANVRIGANAVVTMDVPDNATVVGTNQVRVSPYPKDNRFFFYESGRWNFMQNEVSHPAPQEENAKLIDAFRASRARLEG